MALLGSKRAKYTLVGKIAEKAVVCRSVFLTIWHRVLRSELTKTHSFRLFVFGYFAHWEVPCVVRKSLLIYSKFELPFYPYLPLCSFYEPLYRSPISNAPCFLQLYQKQRYNCWWQGNQSCRTSWWHSPCTSSMSPPCGTGASCLRVCQLWCSEILEHVPIHEEEDN